jgi:DNA-binding transcriptional ArsR family regulator
MAATPHAALNALGDPTRRRILELLREEPRSISSLARGLPVSRPAVSKHLALMRRAGLVRRRRVEGAAHVYGIERRGLREIAAWIEDFWPEALDRFAALAEARAGEDRR